MNEGSEHRSAYEQIVGEKSNTNEGLARLLAVVAAFILVFGTIFWLLIG